jgi:hypothetical protein
LDNWADVMLFMRGNFKTKQNKGSGGRSSKRYGGFLSSKFQTVPNALNGFTPFKISENVMW